jgi:DNA-binding response OmpR family regulator
LSTMHAHPEGSTAPTVAHPLLRESDGGGPIKVLLAQANFDERAPLGATLRDEGYGVVEVQASTELREYFDDTRVVSGAAGLPNLFISDADLVGEPGANVLVELRRTYQHIPVILLSDSFDEETLRQAGALDAAYLFEKPTDTDAVVLAALTLVDPVESASTATSFRWRRWHQGVRPPGATGSRH